MRSGASPTFARDLDLLYRVGSASGLSDGELLGRFTSQPGAVAQHAFEAIVNRHGPMVMAVCRRVLFDEQIRRGFVPGNLPGAGGSMPRDPQARLAWSLVARRREPDFPRASGLAGRRKERERLLVLPRLYSSAPAGSDLDAAELRSALDEEIERLPSAYRRAIVTCLLEGKTQEDAARELGWTKGTVSGRLAQAEDLLRARLARRGLAPAPSVLPVLLCSDGVSASIPASLSSATWVGPRWVWCWDGRRPT